MSTAKPGIPHNDIEMYIVTKTLTDGSVVHDIHIRNYNYNNVHSETLVLACIGKLEDVVKLRDALRLNVMYIGTGA